MPNEQLAPQLRNRVRRLRRWRLISIVVAVVAVALAVEFQPIIRLAQGIRSRRMAAKAEISLAQEKWDDALLKAQTALRLRPEEPTAIRVAARVLGQTGQSAGAVALWQQLKTLKALLPSDRRSFAEDLLRSGSLQEAGPAIEELLREQPNDPAVLRLAARRAAAMRNFDEALDFAIKAQRLEPANVDGQLLLGLVQCESRDISTRDRGLKTLLEVAKDRKKPGLEALQYLSSRQGLPPEAVAAIIPLLREHPAATENQRLLTLDLEIALHSTQRTALIDAAMARYQSASPGMKRAFGLWLNGHNEFARLLTLIPLDEAFKRKDLLLVHLDALAGLKRWNQIQDILETEGAPLDEVYTELFLARSFMELGLVSKADLHWRKAQVAAASSPEQMWVLGSYAEKVGQIDRAEQAFRSLTTNSATARPAYEALLRLAQRVHNTAVLRDILAEMYGRWPKDQSVQNDYAYLNLLLGPENATEYLQIAKKLVAEAPANLSHRTTLALAEVRLGDGTAALAAYDGLSIPWSQVGANHRAVHAAALGLAGRTNEARTEVATLRPEDLRAEELDLIRPWRVL